LAEKEERDDQSQVRSELFEALSHETRIRILQALGEQSMSFAGLKKALQIESSGNLQHHLGKLSGLVKQTDDGLYALTDDGKEALRTLDAVRDIDRASTTYLKESGNSRWRRGWWLGLDNPRLFPLVVVKALLIVLAGVAAYMYQPTFQGLLLFGSMLSLGFAYFFAGLLSRLRTGRRLIASLALLLLSSWLFLYVCTMYFSTIAVSGLWNIIMTVAFWLPVYLLISHRFLGIYERKW
jgi:DNA-binding transcriptional ArsR family regulator